MNTLKFGNAEWYGKKDTILAYNDLNSNYKPLLFNFSRASKATVINKDGLIEEVGSGEPRIDYKDDSKGALLLEPQRTNLVLESNNFDNYYSKILGSTISSNVEISPDGTQNADKVIRGTGDLVLRRSSQVSTGTEYAFSVYAKKGSFSTMALDIGDEGTITFTLTDEWQKFTVVANPSTFTHIDIALPNSSQGDFIYLYGAQVEEGSYATSYIPTSVGAVTRLADSCLKDDINTSIINSSYPFTMYVESTYIGGNRHILTFAKSTTTNNYYVIRINTNEVMLDARANGSTELIESGTTLVNGQKFKVAITMESATSGKICVNGNTVVSKTNFSNQAVNNDINDLLLGQLRVPLDTGERLPVTDVRLYNTALTDQELIALTQV